MLGLAPLEPHLSRQTATSLHHPGERFFAPTKSPPAWSPRANKHSPQPRPVWAAGPHNNSSTTHDDMIFRYADHLMGFKYEAF